MGTVGIGPSSVSRWVLEQPAVGHSSRLGWAQGRGTGMSPGVTKRVVPGVALASLCRVIRAGQHLGQEPGAALGSGELSSCVRGSSHGRDLPAPGAQSSSSEPRFSRLRYSSLLPLPEPAAVEPRSRQPALSRAELFLLILRATARSWEQSCGSADPVCREQRRHCPGAPAVGPARRPRRLFSSGLDAL